jgi:hypothetical protein
MADEERIRTARPDGDRASILAEMATLETAPEETPAPAAAPANGTPPAEPPADEPDDDADEPDEDEAETDDDDDDEESEAAGDADTQRRLGIVQRADKRRREAFAAERQAFETERERWRQEQASVADKAARHDGLGSRFAVDPVGVALELDVPEDQYEYIAEQFFRLCKKAQEDPRHKEAARIARLERQLAERDRREKESETRAANARKAQEANEAANQRGAEYLAKVTKRATDGAAAKHAKGAPDIFRGQIVQITLELMGDSHEYPPAKRVLREFEKRKRAEYAALGFTVAEGVAADKAAATSTDKPTATPAAKAAAKPVSKPAGIDAPVPTDEATTRRNRDAERRAILAEIKQARQSARE